MKLKKRTVSVILLLLFVVLVLAALFVPTSQEHRLRAVCRVRTQAAYAVTLGKGDTLFLSVGNDSLPQAWLRSADVEQTADQSAAFVSARGHLVTSDAVAGGAADSLNDDELRSRLARLDTVLIRRLKSQRGEKEELDDYAKTHSVVDDGYNEVMAYRTRTTALCDTTDSVRRMVEKALRRENLRARLFLRIEVISPYAAKPMRASTWVRGNGLVLAQLDTLGLPAGASRFSVLWTGARQSSARLLAFNDLGCPSLNYRPSVVGEGCDTFPAAEGGVYVNASGHLCAVNSGGERVAASKIVALMRRLDATPVWWARGVAQMFRDFPWRSGGKASVCPQTDLPCRCLLLPDSAFYVGQVDESRKVGKRAAREGYGTLTLASGAVYKGVWKADTLKSGEREDGEGTYLGSFNAGGEPQGQGTLLLPRGGCYRGEWQDGKRTGHGFESKAGRMVRCGEWKGGRFLGERMVYTADRVYGIDLSRHQHEQGRKRFAIDWDNLRITSLGNGRRVKGRVDYPVSYVYIKSTEGKSVYNKYYAADLRQARARGIRAGSYHFFSTYSTGAQQSAYFLKMTWIADTDLPPVLDLEPSEAQIKKMGGEQALFREVLVWLRTVRQRCGKKPILYVGQQFVNKHLPNAPEEIRGHDVWIARYGEYKPYVRLLHWQLTPYGRVRGIRTEVDINVFNGTKEDFAKL